MNCKWRHVHTYIYPSERRGIRERGGRAALSVQPFSHGVPKCRQTDTGKACLGGSYSVGCSVVIKRQIINEVHHGYDIIVVYRKVKLVRAYPAGNMKSSVDLGSLLDPGYPDKLTLMVVSSTGIFCSSYGEKKTAGLFYCCHFRS